MKVIRGKVHGKTIELEEETGQADGQEVDVQIMEVSANRKWGDGILRTAGALADDTHWDAIMEQVQHARKRTRQAPLEAE